MSKIWAIHGGGDWTDASAEYLILPTGVDISAENEAWQRWYRSEYIARREAGNKIPFKDFKTWLIERGAREPSTDELEVFADVL